MKRKIIVAPLNWGLGHASRCVPIIHFLLENNFVPIIASDGKALDFLEREFPNLESLELPSYGISYAKNLKVCTVEIPDGMTENKVGPQPLFEFYQEVTLSLIHI